MCFRKRREKEKERYERYGGRYSGPLILHGRIGRSILETIRNTPKPDDSKLEEEVERLREKIEQAKRDGTF